jgi:hypothetical protein
MEAQQEKESRFANLNRLKYKLDILDRKTVTLSKYLQDATKVLKNYKKVQKMKDAVAQGKPFANIVDSLLQDNEEDQVIQSVLLTVRDKGVNGVNTIDKLVNSFDDTERNVRKYSLVPVTGSLMSIVLSNFLSLFLFRKDVEYINGVPLPLNGKDTEAVLGRARHHLRKDNDIFNALVELRSLNGWGEKMADSWCKAARDYLEVEQALNVIDLHLNIMNTA